MTLALAPGVVTTQWTTSRLSIHLKETFVSARVEQGRSEFWTAGKVYRSGPGSILLKQPGDIHRDLAREGLGVVQIIGFTPELVDVAKHVHPILEPHDPRGVMFHRLHDAVSRGESGLALEVAVAEAITAFTALGDARVDLSRPVRRAMEMLRERYAEPIKLDDLADHAELDKFHLCRAFRAQIGMPPHAYLTRFRIMRAKELLDAGVRPSDVAPRVGLYDQSQLNRHFRRIVGTTPGQFAQRAQS